MTDQEQIRADALREAAAIAHVWTESYADLENSSNPELAKAMAVVTRHTAEAIENQILKAIDQPRKVT
jgi:hypothetical protein